MISKNAMDECLGKLGMLKRFPVSERVVNEVAKMLDKMCSCDEEARQFVSSVIDDTDEWPGPARLKEIHSRVAVGRAYAAGPAGCGICDNGRLQIFMVEERATHKQEIIRPTQYDTQSIMRQRDELFAKYRGSQTHIFYDACSEYCSCPAGRFAQEQTRRAFAK
jgi:hypothetical protein